MKSGGRIYAVDDFEDAEADANLDLLAKDADDIPEPVVPDVELEADVDDDQGSDAEDEK